MRSATMGFAVLAVTCVLFAAVVIAQQAPMPARETLPDGPRIFDSSRRGPSGRPIPGPQFRVVPMKVYFTYYREKAGDKDAAAAVLARGRFDGKAMTEIRDIFVTDTMVAGASAARFVFGRDGKIYLAIGVPLPYSGRAGLATMSDAQDPASYFGKILRFNDDGSVPSDNPFA